ncbi:MAG: LptF/LptG family permease [Holosporaceae bacterium]|nr:LptF/LptG family permease [Holosporaceae bacterium]
MQLNAILFVSIFVFGLILVFDFAEVTRKYPISNMEETFFAIKLSLLRTPSTFSEILHYIYFITATFSLWNLCQSHQITILKSTGRSPQQILYPFLSFAAIVAMIWLFVFHSGGLFLETLYHRNISPNFYSTKINHNIWIDCSEGDKVIFIKTVCDNKIEGLNIFDTKNGSRIFAQYATIENSVWSLKNVITIENDQIKSIDAMKIPGVVSIDLIDLLSKSPGKQDIYDLYKIYKIQSKDHVVLKAYELELHKLLANCFNFLLFALIAALICFPINRYKTKTNIAIKIISTSIFLRFANSTFESLACGGVIPVQLACWAVLLMLTCFSIAVLIWREV